MKKIWAIAAWDLYSTMTNRSLFVIMFVTPIVLSTIIGLAFGGLGSGGLQISDIPVAVVNLDTGMSFANQFEATAAGSASLPADDSDATHFAFGPILVEILSGDTQVQDEATGGSGTAATAANREEGGFTLPPCQLTVGDEATEPLFSGSLEELLSITKLDNVATARAGVDRGDYAAAVIIPAGFSQSLMPTFDFGQSDPAQPDSAVDPAANQVEVYGDRGQPILATIVAAIVKGIVNQFGRSSIALGALADTLLQEVGSDLLDGGALDASGLDLAAAPEPSAPWSSWQTFLQPLGSVSPWFRSILNADASTIENVGCLFSPELNKLTVVQQPLGEENRDQFGRVMVNIGAAQAVFFALFTGVFGIASIYDDRKNGTLQRLMVAPMPKWNLLAGKLLGNVVVVTMQILLLLLAMTVVASLVMGTFSFIWGSQIGLLLLLVLTLGLAVSGIGVFVVGLARTEEQVSIFGPMISMAMGALGGTFGFALPVAVAQFSLIYWGVDGFRRLASGQTDISLHLLILFGQGVVFFLIGTWFYRQRMTP